MTKQPVLPLFISLLLGIAISCYASYAMWQWIFLGSCCLVLLAYKQQMGQALTIFLMICCAGALHGSFAQQPPLLDAIWNSACGDGTTLWQVKIDAPVNHRIAYNGQIRQITFGQLLQERCHDSWIPRRGRIHLSLQPGQQVVRGDTIMVQLSLQPPAIKHHMYAQDPQLYMQRENLNYHVYVASEHALIHFSDSLLGSIDRLRFKIEQGFEKRFSTVAGAIGRALSVGDTYGINPDMRETWADAGMAHLLAVSGLHVGMVAMLLFYMWRLLLIVIHQWFPNRFMLHTAAFLTLPGLWLFCLLTGCNPPVMRATYMLSAAYIALILGYPTMMTNAWSFAGLMILLWEPLSIYNPGFLLSFVAVAGFLWFKPPAGSLIFSKRIITWAATACVMSCIATLITIPILAFYFYRISLIAVLSNIVAVPFCTLIVVPCVLMYSAFVVFLPHIASFLAGPTELVLLGLQHLAHFFASFSWSAINTPPWYWFEIVTYSAMLVTIFMWWHTKRRVLMIACGVCGVLLAVFFSIRLYHRHGNGWLSTQHIYVGEGDASLVTFPEGAIMLVDGGGAILSTDPDPGRDIVAKFLRYRDIHKIDIVVLTHPHPDHLGGLLYVTSHFPVGQFWWNGDAADMPAVQNVISYVKKSGGRIYHIKDLPHHQLYQHVDVDIIHPNMFDEKTDLNNHSIVLKLQYKDRSILLAGDIERETESLLSKTMHAVDVLKVPHHGSRTSSSSVFLDVLQPKAAIISCGENNRFGFPHTDVLKRYQDHHVSIFRTDTDGLVTVRTNGVSICIAGINHQQECF